MALIPLAEYAKKNGRLPVSVRQKAIRGGFATARKLGRDWFIDEDEVYPDNRIKTGDYVDWRHKGMQEIYRSYNMLDMAKQEGIAIYQTGGGQIQVEIASVDNAKGTTIFRFPAPANLPDWASWDWAAKYDAIFWGREAGQIFVKGKWRDPQKIQEQHQDQEWLKYI